MRTQPFVKMWDQSSPTPKPPRWLKAVAGYIGGDTPHIWTLTEWAFFPRCRKLPMWVAPLTGPRDGLGDAFLILQRIWELQIPTGSAIVIDMETTVDAVYLNWIRSVLNFFGYKVWVYGSLDFVFGNPACDGYFVADYTGLPHMVAGIMVRATQYRNTAIRDTSLVKWINYLRDIKWR